MIKQKNTGEGSHLKRDKLAAGLVLTVLLFSVVGLVIDILPERSGIPYNLWEGYLSVPLGHLKSGVVIHGSYQFRMGGLRFFITNEGNHNRWLSGLSYYSYSLGQGSNPTINIQDQSFSFAIPYEDEWYAIFEFLGGTYPWFSYEIHIGPLGFLTVISIMLGTIVALIIGITFIRGGRLEPLFEPTTGPIGDEITPMEIEPRMPDFICPNCGHGNPRDADFCAGCGQDLDLTDDVSR